MTHPEQHTAIQSALEVLVEEGFDGMAEAMQILFTDSAFYTARAVRSSSSWTRGTASGAC
jgi:hypothetical protein